MNPVTAASLATRIESILDGEALVSKSSQLPSGSYIVETSIPVTVFENERMEISRPFKTVFWIRPDYPIVSAAVSLTERIAEGRREVMCELLARINSLLAVGAFAMNPDEGYVFYYNAMIAHDDEVPPVIELLGTCQRIIGNNIREIESLLE